MEATRTREPVQRKVLIVEEIAVALATGIAKETGAIAVEDAFEGQQPASYFDDVYRELSKIVGQKVERNTIDAINGQIAATESWVRDEYLPHKLAQDWSSRELVNRLQAHSEALGASIGLLLQPDYAQAALGVFMVAAGMQLALVQEQTLVDPAAATPDASAYDVTLRARAQSYYNHVLDTMTAVLAARARRVTIEKTSSVFPAPDADRRRYGWVDSVTGSKGKVFHTREEAEQDRAKHLADVCRKLVEGLKNPITSALKWLSVKLEYDAAPLYATYTTNPSGYFYDYSTAQDYAGRAGIEGWIDTGTFGWMGGSDGEQPGAVVPVYRVVAASNPSYVRIVFNESDYNALEPKGVDMEGTGLLGYLWKDPAAVPAGQAVPVYAAMATGEGTGRTQLVRSAAEYQTVLGSPGWRNAGGLVGYLCSQG